MIPHLGSRRRAKPVLARATAPLACTLAVIGLAGCVYEAPPPPPPVYVERPPPPPRAHPYWVWQRGAWRWDGYRWVWIPGRYVERVAY